MNDGNNTGMSYDVLGSFTITRDKDKEKPMNENHEVITDVEDVQEGDFVTFCARRPNRGQIAAVVRCMEENETDYIVEIEGVQPAKVIFFHDAPVALPKNRWRFHQATRPKVRNFYVDWNREKWMTVLENLLTAGSWGWMRHHANERAMTIEGVQFGPNKFVDLLEKSYEHPVLSDYDSEMKLMSRVGAVLDGADTSGDVQMLDGTVWTFLNVPQLVSDLADVFMEAVQDA
ncbi:hypothetical protein [Bifidobacterium cuniculi]|uniref:Uncharacterized protein n=1 Tax=Bifidobacterium cuniculi TaxID=1688 RepID=A0A087B4Y4_9BIFI|nr:hypothetical protein [Bifidobacterium cuniculi]KFI66084.1 hypothetical protein BCUN_0586 [Bifidobacterium cuniculi]